MTPGIRSDTQTLNHCNFLMEACFYLKTPIVTNVRSEFSIPCN